MTKHMARRENTRWWDIVLNEQKKTLNLDESMNKSFFFCILLFDNMAIMAFLCCYCSHLAIAPFSLSSILLVFALNEIRTCTHSSKRKIVMKCDGTHSQFHINLSMNRRKDNRREIYVGKDVAALISCKKNAFTLLLVLLFDVCMQICPVFPS